MTLEKLEEQRLKIRNFYIITFVIAAVGAVLLVAFKVPEIAIFYVFAVILFAGLIENKNNKEYLNNFKKFFVKSALETKFTNLKYTPNQGMSYQTSVKLLVVTTS